MKRPHLAFNIIANENMDRQKSILIKYIITHISITFEIIEQTMIFNIQTQVSSSPFDKGK